MSDRYVAACLLGFGVAYTGFALQIEEAVVGHPWGPKLLPLVIGTGIIGLSSVLLWRSQAAVAPAGAPRSASLPLVATVGIILLYAFSYEWLGYLLATAGSLHGLLMLHNRKRWVTNAAVAATFSCVAYALFRHVLGVYLPVGILG